MHECLLVMPDGTQRHIGFCKTERVADLLAARRSEEIVTKPVRVWETISDIPLHVLDPNKQTRTERA